MLRGLKSGSTDGDVSCHRADNKISVHDRATRNYPYSDPCEGKRKENEQNQTKQKRTRRDRVTALPSHM